MSIPFENIYWCALIIESSAQQKSQANDPLPKSNCGLKSHLPLNRLASAIFDGRTAIRSMKIVISLPISKSNVPPLAVLDPDGTSYPRAIYSVPPIGRPKSMPYKTLEIYHYYPADEEHR